MSFPCRLWRSWGGFAQLAKAEAAQANCKSSLRWPHQNLNIILCRRARSLLSWVSFCCDCIFVCFSNSSLLFLPYQCCFHRLLLYRSTGRLPHRSVMNFQIAREDYVIKEMKKRTSSKGHARQGIASQAIFSFYIFLFVTFLLNLSFLYQMIK